MLYLQGNDPVRVQCAFVDTPEAVSYTHLDVYKRQGIDRAASRIHQAETFFTASGYKGEFTTTDFFNFSSASRYQLILIHDVICLLYTSRCV